MHISAEVQLIVLIGALYLYDCVALVYHNQVVVRRTRQGWHVAFPRDNATFGRRLMLMLPLLAPFYPAYKLSWNIKQGSVSGDAERSLAGFQTADELLFSKIAPVSAFLGFGVLLAIPFGLRFLSTVSFLGLLAVLYSGIVFQLIRLWRIRASFHLPTEKFSSLAFESIACPPCAVNLLRKVSLNTTPELDLIDFVERTLPVEQQMDIVGEVIKRVEADLVIEEENSPAARDAQEYVMQLRRRFNFATVGSSSDAKDLSAEAPEEIPQPGASDTIENNTSLPNENERKV